MSTAVRISLIAVTVGSLFILACGEDAPNASGDRDARAATDKDGGASDKDGGANAGADNDAGSSARDAGQARDAAPQASDAARDSGPTAQGEDAGSGLDSGGGAAIGRFSFFMTSQAGLARLSGEATGFGGDLRFGKADGLSGADEICRQLAESSMPGNGKTWRAFLSVTKGPNGMPVNAIDRVGAGPWYDRRDHLFAMNKAGLMSVRPVGCDPTIINDFPNEDGVPNHNPGTGIVDNHNTLTGSSATGTLDTRGLSATCQDWTNSEADGGKPRCGVSWPRGQLMHWISTLDEGGCAPGATPPGAESGARGTVGALGGYGGFFCFALTP